MDLSSIKVGGFRWANRFGLTLPPLTILYQVSIKRLVLSCDDIPNNWNIFFHELVQHHITPCLGPFPPGQFSSLLGNNIYRAILYFLAKYTF